MVQKEKGKGIQPGIGYVLGMAIGLSMGFSIGMVLDSIPIGIAIGSGLGVSLGISFEQANKPMSEEEKARARKMVVIGVILLSILALIFLVMFLNLGL